MIQDGLRQTTLWDPGKMLFPTRGNQNPIQSGHGCSLIIIGPCSDLFNLDMDAYMDILPLTRPNQQKYYPIHFSP